MATRDEYIEVEVVYAVPDEQRSYTVHVPLGSTVGTAVAASGVGEDHPELDLARCPVGIYGERVDAGTVVDAGDRIEIYRPLIADPKESRRRRAAKRAGR